MKKPVMFWCGVGVVILGIVSALNGQSPYNPDPTVTPRAIGAILAGIAMAIYGSRKKQPADNQKIVNKKSWWQKLGENMDDDD